VKIGITDVGVYRNLLL